MEFISLAQEDGYTMCGKRDYSPHTMPRIASQPPPGKHQADIRQTSERLIIPGVPSVGNVKR
jgi:hypothetical protein